MISQPNDGSVGDLLYPAAPSIPMFEPQDGSAPTIEVFDVNDFEDWSLCRQHK